MQDQNARVVHLQGFRKPGKKLKALSWVLAVAVTQPWGLMGIAHAAYVEETSLNMPVDSANSYALDAADINGDGIHDLIVANRGQSVLLLSNGLGGFDDETAARLPASLHTTLDAAFADVDGVNGVDIVMVGDGQNRVYMNDGTGVFADETAARLPEGINTSLAVAVADLDSDGDADIVVGNRRTSNQILMNDGSGVFADESAARLSPDTDFTYGVALGDSNGNGSPDIFFANFSGQNRLHTNNFLGIFTDVTGTNLPAGVGSSGDAVFLDIDADGDQDIAVADGPAGATLLINDGSGSFADGAPGQTPALSSFAVKVSAGDINFDGATDLFVSSLGQDNVLLNDGAGTFADATATEMPVDTRRTFGSELLDADADLDLDLVAATPQGQNRYYENSFEPPRVELGVSPDYIEIGDTVTLTVNAFDEDGIGALDVLVVQPASGPATPTDIGGGEYTFVPSEDGIHTLQVTATDNDSPANTIVRTRDFLVQLNDTTDPVVTLGITPPSIIQGQSADFSVSATDDRGVVGLTLSVGGVNVPLDSLGQATFTPSATGSLAVVAEATDAAGNIGVATDTLTVAADVVPPTVTVTATPDPVDITQSVSISVVAADDIALANLVLTVTGPAGGPVDEPLTLTDVGGDTYTATYTPFIPGLYTFEATAQDAANIAVATDTVQAEGIPDDEPPVVTVTATPSTTIPGATVTLTVEATDNVFVLDRTLEVNGVPQALDAANQATFSPPSLGVYTATATATDPTGNVGTDSVVFDVVDPATDTEPPVVDITSPSEGSDIANVTTFVGTATDLTLVSYEMSYRMSGTTDPFTLFDSGSQVVENGPLGSLDTTILENGLVDIRLSAIDINGASSSIVRTYSANGGFKPGMFTLSYQDISLPLAGIPVTVFREYDSRRKDISDDFGNGWQLRVVDNATYTNNRALGDGWFVARGGGFFNWPCSVADERKYHITEIRISDTEFYKFALQAEFFGLASSISGGCTGQVSFTQVGGNPGATLDILGSIDVFWQNASNFLTYDIGDVRFGDVWNPEDVRLTTFDGREYDLNLSTGLERLGDGKGNSIFINANGVISSTGAQVLFTRDGAGRITRITDPLNQTIAYAYDANGNLISHTDRDNDATTFFYSADNYLERVVDPQGNDRLTNEYDADGRLLAQVDADGNRTEFSRDVDLGTETITEPDGTVSILQYDDDGNLTAANVNGEESTYTYDANGNKLTETDANGNTTTFSYDANDQMLSETDALGNTMTYSYISEGRPLQVGDPLGNELNFVYDANGNLSEQRDAGGNLIQGMVQTPDGRLTELTTAAGTSTMTYDAQGNLLTKTEPNGLLRTYTYDALNRRISASVDRTVGGSTVRETTAYTYDGEGNILTVTDPLGGVESYVYDGNDNVISETDALGRVTTHQYDDRNLRVRTDYPDGTVELFGYDLKGRLTALTDTGGRTRFFDYDANDRLTRTIFEDGSSVIRVYDGAGNVLSQTDARGNTITYEYDAADRVTRRTDPDGSATEFTYAGNQVRPATVTDPLGNVTTYTYDTSMMWTENLLSKTYADTAIESQTWGANSRLTTKTNENGNTTTYTYDALGNLASATDALGNITTYTYDEVGNRLTETDALGRTTVDTYDALGRRVSRTLPSGDSMTWTYDLVGNVVSITDYNGATVTNEYDSRDRLVRRVYPDTSEDTFTYTTGGMLATATNALGTSSFTYDALDRMLTSTDPNGSVVTYAYDVAGNRTSVSATGGAVTYTHNARDRIATITDPDGGITSYGYDLNGNVTSIAYPNGTSAALSYDVRNRTVRVTHTGPGGAPVLADYQYSLDAVGNRTQVIEAAGRTLDFSYDALNRLTQVIEDPAGAALTSNYTYDAAGNILTIALPGGTATATYDINNRVLTAGGRTFTHDDNGNITLIDDAGALTVFLYDDLNRLIRRTESDGTITDFEYDAEGNRVARVVDGVRTEYVLDRNDSSGVAQVLEERDDVGTLAASYARGHGPVRMERGSTSSYFHPDALGSTRALTNAAGVVTDTYDYDAYGNLVGGSGGTTNEFLFTGEQTDPSTGLTYLRARYYDPEIARFISPDPVPADLFNPQTLNRYAYVTNNPLNMVDPNGEFGLVSVSISISIVSVLSTIAYTQVYKPAKDVYDKIIDITQEIPNGVLNKEAKRDELGLTLASASGALADWDLTQIIEMGDGIVGKSYDIVYGMSTTMGQVVALIHARNSAEWMKYLPQHEEIPGNYVDCSFNNYVQKTYTLGWITGLSAAKRFQTAANVIAAYLAYFNFLSLVSATVSDSEALPQPVEDASPGDTACSVGGGS